MIWHPDWSVVAARVWFGGVLTHVLCFVDRDMLLFRDVRYSAAA